MKRYLGKSIIDTQGVSEVENDAGSEQVADKQREEHLTPGHKRVLIAKLRERGLTPGHFGKVSDTGLWERIIAWLKAH